MPKAQYGILRFAKYKGPEIGQIEAHNERTKESYASNPDIDTNRSKLNFNLLPPPPKYRAEAERQIREAGCRTRKDSVRLVETLITASPEFFQGKSDAEVLNGTNSKKNKSSNILYGKERAVRYLREE